MTTTLTRARFAGDDEVDVLVIGGGITGAALAHEATSRGLSVALVEQGDVGGATSAATGKLVHGGLRYLKRLEVGLVRESLAERRTLMRIAPNLVEPLPIVLPDPGPVEHAGLVAYDLLSADRNRGASPDRRIPAHRTLRRSELDRLGLPTLRSGLLYHDALCLSPERLTLAFLRTAAAAGARWASYTRADRFVVERGRVVGAEVTDLAADRPGLVRARITVNATGPWARDLLLSTPLTAALAGPEPTVRSEGIYLVTRVPTEVMVLTVLPHGHFSFAPWRGLSLVGPTETPYHGRVADWRLTRRAVDDLVAAVSTGNTGGIRIAPEDVVAAYGGLRPLTESGGTDTYTASRASEVVDHDRDGAPGLVTATGGKYTTARAFASRVVTGLATRLGTTVRRSTTDRTPLDGCVPGDLPGAVDATTAAAAAVGVDARSAALLTRLHGTEAAAVLDLVREDPALARPVTPDGEPLATVAYAARHEAPVHLTDVLLRRTGVGQTGDPGDEVLGLAADVVARERGWDAGRRAAEVAAARTAVRLPVD
ncbi:glycerol-3-phosphate dehydrogenase/oxidase [Cellulomonas triticagri]|uniref:Glycerol-3-phosphate dehydrogenase/oxidase n=1 Tax=Cellulomonas triticagri TaxID=2483352 RepID=A0A3M2JK37_9CELL|nr:glycerol-3-phosphate dehydrogenase/oxidase [Cellulomonas triticagri]RMI14457.1 glycerol-3-phosphate dehydrogenase/oxidase [Cellulomonas triticagri]